MSEPPRPAYQAAAEILAAAFSPPQWSDRGRLAARLGFQAVLWRARRRGAVATIPGRAVCVLSPPRPAPDRSRNPMDLLGATCWRLSSFGAHPTGLGVGTALLSEVCLLADQGGYDICLRAGERSARLYRRAGFTDFEVTPHGTVMLRSHRPPDLLHLAGRVHLAGRKAGEFGVAGGKIPRNRVVQI